MGLTSGTDHDRVRALVARTALGNGDGSAACNLLSAAILRRAPRRPGVRRGGQVEDGELAFAPELCEALDLVVGRGGGGDRRGDDDGERKRKAFCVRGRGAWGGTYCTTTVCACVVLLCRLFRPWIVGADGQRERRNWNATLKWQFLAYFFVTGFLILPQCLVLLLGGCFCYPSLCIDSRWLSFYSHAAVITSANTACVFSCTRKNYGVAVVPRKPTRIYVNEQETG